MEAVTMSRKRGATTIRELRQKQAMPGIIDTTAASTVVMMMMIMRRRTRIKIRVRVRTL